MDGQKRTYLKNLVTDLVSLYRELRAEENLQVVNEKFKKEAMCILERRLVTYSFDSKTAVPFCIVGENSENNKHRFKNKKNNPKEKVELRVSRDKYYIVEYGGIRNIKSMADSSQFIEVSNLDCQNFFKLFTLIEQVRKNNELFKIDVKERINIHFKYTYKTDKITNITDFNIRRPSACFNTENESQKNSCNALFNVLVPSSGRKDEGKYLYVKDFFHGQWNDFFKFSASALLMFNIYNDGFDQIRLCKKCGRMFVPKRAGEDRGLYCPPTCQKNAYNEDNKEINSCRQKHRTLLNGMLKVADISEHVIETSFKPLKFGIAKCRECLLIKKGMVKSGNCPIFVESDNFNKLRNQYEVAKKSKKKKN